MANPSLDELLKQIEQEAADELNVASLGGDEVEVKVSAGMDAMNVHEEVARPASPSPLNVDFQASSIPQITRQYLGGGAVVSDNVQMPGLTPRQKALPKLSFRMLGSIAAILVLVIGLGSAISLTQQSQDVRQYAYDPNTRVDPELQQYVADGETVEQPQVVTEGTGEETPGQEMVDTNQAVGEKAVASADEVQVPTMTPWWQQPIVIAGAALVISALLILVVFLHWLFAV